jgi:hypothetical protein
MELDQDLVAASATPIGLASLAGEDRSPGTSEGPREWMDGMLFAVLRRLRSERCMRWTLLLGALAALSGCTSAPAPRTPSTPLVLRGVTVIDGTGAPPYVNVDVVIEGERIVAIHPGGRERYAADATVLELSGRYLLPGLIDTHAHAAVLRGHPDGSGPGVAPHEELEVLVAEGIPPLEVLTIPTRNGAETPGLLEEIGTVEVGKRADLLVLGAAPTGDIRNTRCIELIVQGGRPLHPHELVDGAARFPTLHTGERRPGRADAPAPTDRVEPGIGVLAFADPPGTGRVRTDTLRIRTEPNPSSTEKARFLLHEHSGSAWSYVLRTDLPARSNAVEFAYEEQGLPFDSLAGAWARVIYGWPTGGPPLRGWVSLAESRARALLWADLLRQRNLFWEDPAGARFYDAPGGSAVDIRIIPPGISWASYDLVPLRADGSWMLVRVVVPSICSGEDDPTERLAWIRYLDPAGRPLVRARTRGC